MTKQITTSVSDIQTLSEIAKGKIVELPGWDDDTSFFARLKRPSLQIMASKGQIPNELLSTAGEVFYGSSKSNDNVVSMKDMASLQLVMVKASLVEPSMEELEEAGIMLTDEQIVAIFQYSQLGIKGLAGFRTEPASNKGNKSK